MTMEPHDQTRGDSAPFIDTRQTALLSRNEVAALCMKAARGAGMSWGLAEEAGYAAAWLVQRGFDGPRYLKEHLAHAQGRDWAHHRPTVTPDAWQAPSGKALCPVTLGAALCDHADLPGGPLSGDTIRIDTVDHPALLLPFLATIAVSGDSLTDIAWEDGAVCIGGEPSALAPAIAAFEGRRMPLSLTARPGKVQAVPDADTPRIAAATIAALNDLAMLTTVPASDASRAGAGSTAGDDD